MKSEAELKGIIRDAYVEKYKGKPENYNVDPIIYDCFGGDAAVVTYNFENNNDSEICLVEDEKSVHIFSSTAELLRFLERRQKESFSDRFFTRKVFTPVVFIILILCTVWIGIAKPGSQALPILGSAVGLAAIFFFGEGTRK